MASLILDLLRSTWNRIGTARVPVLNLEVAEVKTIVWEKIQEPSIQCKLILVIVCIALLLDNMLYMVIVPIIPDYLRYTTQGDEPVNITKPAQPIPRAHHGEDSATGILFASKAIVQLAVNPFSGALIDRIGYDVPMMIGLSIMFLSTTFFACGRSYSVLFFARSLQGVGSAFADTAGLAMIANRFTEENQRSQALGIALAFISFGSLVAPPFGGALYQFAGKEIPFLILALVSLLDGIMLLLVMKPSNLMRAKEVINAESNIDNDGKSDTVKTTTPIWKLFMDPYIAVCSGALMMSNVALAFLEPTISIWMEDNITTDNWKIGMIWLPAFFPHVFGVILTVKMSKRYPNYQWLMVAFGLTLEGLCCFVIPFSTSYQMLMIPICGICFGIALVDTAILPTLGYIVDVRYVSVYGSIYAIADISYSLAYAIGPILAGEIVEAIGFTWLNVLIAVSNLAYAPVLIRLRNIYEFKPFKNETDILMSNIPNQQYRTYTTQDDDDDDDEQLPQQQQRSSTDLYEQRKSTAIAKDKYKEQSSFQFNRNEDYYATKNYNQDNLTISTRYKQEEATPSIVDDQGARLYDRVDGVSGAYDRIPPDSPAYKKRKKLRDPERFNSEIEFIADSDSEILSKRKNSLSFNKVGYYYNDKPSVRKLFANLEQLEEEIPKLPLPDLETTIEEYLRNLKPILTDIQYEKAEQLASEFISENGIGQKLQEILMSERHKHDNWAYDWWLNDMYLENLSPLPINSNPGMVFAPRKTGICCLSIDEMAIFGSKVVLATLEFKNSIDEDKLPQEYTPGQGKRQPLCMAQYKRLFTSYRVPGMFKDDLIKSETDYTKIHPHISVVCNNQFYVIQLTINKDGEYIKEETLKMQLRSIIEENTEFEYRVLPVGILTAHRRDVWAEYRRKLMKDEDNRRNIHLIESSILILCFDLVILNSKFNEKHHHGETIFKTFNRDETNMLHQMIHGGGSSANSGNRWFDKTIQFVISPDGVNGICYEHSPAEGVAVIQAMETIQRKCENIENSYDYSERSAINEKINLPRKLEWYLGNKIKAKIRDTMQFLDEMINDFDTYVYRFTDYGKDYMKSRRVSPDGYIQLGLQLTYYRLYGKLTATYESASTRRFLLGRVDCIRSATIEALKWVQSMCINESNTDKQLSFEQTQILKQQELFEIAMDKQSKVTKDNIFGYGIDVHLLALQQLAKENAVKVNLFEDDSFTIANHFALSTSQVTTNDDSFMGYGAVVDNGYGASYNIKNDNVTFCVSAFKSNETTDSGRFVAVLKESLMMMKYMLDYKTK